jgi:hypothetical protein
MPSLLVIGYEEEHLCRKAADHVPSLELLSASDLKQAAELARVHRPRVVVIGKHSGPELSLVGQHFAPFRHSQLMLVAGALAVSDCLVVMGAGGRLELLPHPVDEKSLWDAIDRALADSQTALPLSEKSGSNIDRHAMANRLTTLLVGLRAFSSELKDFAQDADTVVALVDDYMPRLTDTVRLLAAQIGKPIGERSP